MTYFQGTEYGKGKITNLQWSNLANTYYLSQVMMVSIISDIMLICTPDVIWYHLYGVFSKKQSHSNHEEISDNPRLRNILRNGWPVFLKTVKVMRNKESWRNCYRPETKETWQLNAICCSRLGSGTKGDINGRTGF